MEHKDTKTQKLKNSKNKKLCVFVFNNKKDNL